MPDLTLSALTADQIHAIAVSAKNDLCNREKTLTGCLLEIERRCLHYEWGTSTTAHYAEAVLQLDGHTAREYMRTGRSLEGLPKLAQAYYEGRIPRCKIREITRVATIDTEDYWLDAAAHHNTRQIEMMVARTHKGKKPGEPGGDKQQPRPLKTRVTLDFEPEQMAIVREAVSRVCEVAGEAVSLADAIELMAQEFLNMAHTESDMGNRYRLVIHADPVSRLAWVNSGRGTARVSDEMLDQAMCDAEVLDLRNAESEPPAAAAGPCDGRECGGIHAERPTWDATSSHNETLTSNAFEPAVDAYAGAEGDREGERPTWDAPPSPPDHTFADAGAHGPHPVWDTLADISRGVATHDHAARLSRTVPPTVMRHVTARDQYRCAVPGCEMRIWTEVHHITWRSDGGDHDKENLVLMCTRHHRLVHRGQLFVSGSPSSGLAFRDGHGRLLQGSSPAA